jgi:hypothetical protein
LISEALRGFVCQGCRVQGMKRLGRDGVTALHVGFAKQDDGQ